MVPKWSNFTRQQMTNAILANYSIPVRVRPLQDEQCEGWQVMVLGGTLETNIERMHKKQKDIIERVRKQGMDGVSKQDALFMYVSQWLEWTIVRGHEDAEHEQMTELMEMWITVYMSMSKFTN